MNGERRKIIHSSVRGRGHLLAIRRSHTIALSLRKGASKRELCVYASREGTAKSDYNNCKFVCDSHHELVVTCMRHVSSPQETR